MFGLKKENNLYIFEAVVHTEQLYLNLYDGNRKVRQIAFDPCHRIGDVWRLEISSDGSEDQAQSVSGDGSRDAGKSVSGDVSKESETVSKEAPLDISRLSYCYEADGHVFTDPNGTVFEGRKRFGYLKDGTKILKTPIAEATAVPEISDEWIKDRPLETPYDETIVYRLHVRGFTQHASSGVNKDERGTFQGIIDKIPYLVSLGITAVELMPPYEFNEVMLPDYGSQNPYQEDIKPTGRINYWGFTKDALQLAPKSSFTSDHKNPRNEFRKMVYELHRNNIEVIVDLYFTNETLPDYVTTVMRYWRINYHVDGIHVIGSAPYNVIARDPYLSRFKIWADSWEGQIPGDSHYGGPYRQDTPKYLADYNQGFQNDMRRILKGDESMLKVLMDRIKYNPSGKASIQYMANVAGMSLYDVLSYDRKHNEDNYEDNRDGTNQNYSWNCGEEGSTRKKYIKLLRKKMWRNAYILLMLSQGTPLINAGDECGQTRLGNNNAYCQDNNINWMDWRLLDRNKELYDFARYIISFRKQHKVFHQAAVLKQLDYRSVGIPDMSFHGETAWRPDMENYRRQLGVMYSGDYAEDDTFLVLYNFHWERHEFLLAHPPLGKRWAVCIDTAKEELNGIYPDGQELELEGYEIIIEPRSIVVLRAVRDKSYKPKRRRRRKAKDETAADVNADASETAETLEKSDASVTSDKAEKLENPETSKASDKAADLEISAASDNVVKLEASSISDRTAKPKTAAVSGNLLKLETDANASSKIKNIKDIGKPEAETVLKSAVNGKLRRKS